MINDRMIKMENLMTVRQIRGKLMIKKGIKPEVLSEDSFHSSFTIRFEQKVCREEVS